MVCALGGDISDSVFFTAIPSHPSTNINRRSTNSRVLRIHFPVCLGMPVPFQWLRLDPVDPLRTNPTLAPTRNSHPCLLLRPHRRKPSPRPQLGALGLASNHLASPNRSFFKISTFPLLERMDVPRHSVRLPRALRRSIRSKSRLPQTAGGRLPSI